MTQVSTNGYPMSGGVSGVLRAICGGLPGGPNQQFVRDHRFFHRILYPAAGALNFTFFNVAKTPYITNFPQAAQLPANYGFALHGVGFTLRPGITLATGAPLAAAAQFDGAEQASALAFTQAEAVRNAVENGQVSMWVNDKKVIDDVYGLDCFHPGRGLDGLVAVAGGTTLKDIAAGYVNNGAAFASNRHMFTTPFPIAGGQGIRLEINYQALIPLPQPAVLCAELIGQLISPAGG